MQNKTKSKAKKLDITDKKYVKIRAIIPNTITMLCLWSGVTAIRFASEGHIEYAVLSILLGAFLDGLDGRVARKMNVSSDFGAILDSLADFITFGVAPAMVLYFWSNTLLPFLWTSCLFYTTCSALRLARFNVSDAEKEKTNRYYNYFVGIPAPMAALVVLIPISSFLFWNNLDFYIMPEAELLSLHNLAIVPFLTITGIFMISAVPTFSTKNIIYFGKNSVQFILFLAVVIYGIVENVWFIWQVAFIIYIITIFITSYNFYKNNPKQLKEKDD